MEAIAATRYESRMDPGFGHLGVREILAVLIAVVIIVDWAAVRYGRSHD